MGIVKARKLSVRSKIILFSKTVQDYGNRSANICLVMQAVGQAGHSLSLRLLRSQWLEREVSEQGRAGWLGNEFGSKEASRGSFDYEGHI